MSKSYRLTVCFLSLLALGCGGSESAAPVTLNPNGHWIGSAPNTVNGTITVDVFLTESAGVITGTGAIVATSASPGEGLTLPVLVTGTFAAPTISLAMRSPPGANPSIAGAIPFTGSLSSSTISGLYAGSIAMSLSRQN